MKNNHEKDSGGTEKLDGGARRVRLEDIAARCGTSLSTVSRALSGEKGVSQALRAQILEVARAVRYSPAVEMGGSRIGAGRLSGCDAGLSPLSIQLVCAARAERARQSAGAGSGDPSTF
ncbi:LacI family DNA-binding transcriptional regulator [Symbiopectobacterium purcellii]|uniref:LacI family DNA-binding transcriptional regulator n=1 Tax=Symbiopectobacterium purcellii TaxID=2871826 RepID=UPI0020767CC4|nr:LacI family DNA-binding transcriptional regulator [Symbiopectobacterium purcellii]